MTRLLSALLVLCVAAAPALAADAPARGTAVPTAVPRFVTEARIGWSVQDPSGPESGSGNITGEVLFAKPFLSPNPLLNLLIPRFHLGASANLAGDTSFAYAGFTWTYDITSSIFLEATVGGAVHNGENDPRPYQDRNALGCTPLFRESASLGYRLTQAWSVMATVEHLSNAGLCSQNRGLTNIGVRVGYAF